MANHLTWLVPRPRRSFVVRVIEPNDYDPAIHGDLFREVITAIVSPRPVAADLFSTSDLRADEAFDLMTFPEAFAPASSLLEVLGSLGQLTALGCIHVGLRPSADPQQHLFTVAELKAFLAELRTVDKLAHQDLDVFSDWLDRQRQGAMFNVACLFTLDHDGWIRICLHPKGVRSAAEQSVLPDHTMDEANLLTLVTLRPTNRLFLSITLQPLICADALPLQTDRATTSLIAEVNLRANVFDAPPDHVDIVSVATCTPQRVSTAASGRYREWHQDFRDAFVRAAQDGAMGRHRYATFILSNFETVPVDKPGGLSGIFEPIHPKVETLHRAVSLSCYGHPSADRESNNRWSTPDDHPITGWDSRGYLAGLQPSVEQTGVAVKIFGFTLNPLLRDQSPWKPRHSVTSCDVTVGHWTGGRSLIFSKAGG